MKKISLRALGLGMMTFALACTAMSVDAATLYGLSRDYSTGYGLLSIDTTDPTTASLVKNSGVSANSGAFKDSTLYFVGFDEDFNTLLYKSDIEGNVTKVKNLGEDAPLPMEMTYDINGETMYGVTNSDYTDGMSALWTINVETGTFTKVIDNVGIFVRGLAADANGTLMAMSGDGKLYTIDGSTHKASLVGDTKLKLSTFQSMAFDHNSGILYFANHSTDYVTYLYTIDPSTANATLVGKIGSGSSGIWTVGLGVPYKPSANTAPARVDSLTVTPGAKGALTATLNWINPTTMTNGEPLTSITKAEILVDGEVKATLTSNLTPGAAASQQLTLAQAGMYRFTVRVYNEVGPSADRWVDAWIGPDVPGPVQNAKADLYNTTTNRLSWSAPVIGAHGGYINPSECTYDVIRLNDGKKIAQATSNESLNDAQLADTLTRYTYAIVAINASGAGDTTETNYLVNGPARVPSFTSDFDDYNESQLWTVVNLNEDETTYLWHYDVVTQRNYYMYQASETMYANDWLISPPIEFTEGKTYRITVSACNDFAPYPENFRIYTTSGYNANGAVPMGEEFTCDDANVLHDYSYEFTVEDDGQGTTSDSFISFVSVTCTSRYDMHIFMVGSVKVELVPSGVTEIEADAANEPADVYTIDGRHVAHLDARADLNTSTLPAGMYIVAGKNKTQKIVVR